MMILPLKGIEEENLCDAPLMYDNMCVIYLSCAVLCAVAAHILYTGPNRICGAMIYILYVRSDTICQCFTVSTPTASMKYRSRAMLCLH